jgi:hypothetical protein
MAADDHTQHTAASSTALFTVLHGERLTGRVLGVSAAGLYLHFEHPPFEDTVAAPTVVALLPTSSVRLPLAMVSAGPLPMMDPRDPVQVGNGELRVGPHAWQTTRWFEPRPPGCRAVLPALLAQAARLLQGLGDSEVGLDLTGGWAAAAALGVGDAAPSCALLGAGPGLTPAGDDVVAGALAACALSGTRPPPQAVALLLARARIATTALSAALLSCAAAGQVVPQAGAFLRSLTGTVPVTPALDQLRAVGSTSGTALAVGLVAALGASRFDLLDPALRGDRSAQFDPLGRHLTGSAG